METYVISPEDIARGVIDGVLPVYKRVGETPLECLKKVRASMPSLQAVKMSYAGRLDPLAEGVMLLLIGNTNNEREKYLSLDKVYELDILFGVSTDTGDLLGVVKDELNANGASTNSASDTKKLDKDFIENEVKKLVGNMKMPYPAYSSKTVNGKALFQYAREGKLGDIEIPTTDTKIYSTEILGWSELTREQIFTKAKESIDLVKGDFRQAEILVKWHGFAGLSAGEESVSEKDNMSAGKNGADEEKFNILKIKVHCSSGTYMRTLGEYLGEKAGVPALAWHIKRLEVDGIGLEEVYVG